MSTVRRLVLLAVVVAFSVKTNNALTISDEEVQKYRDALVPHVTECGEQFGVNKEDFDNAKDHHEIDTCFIACVFKKAGIINEKGSFDHETASEKGKEFFSNSEEIAAVNEDCSSVNDMEVSDGEAGCERSKLLLDCYLKHKNKVQH